MSNYSLYTLPAAVVVAYYPHFIKGYLVSRQTGKWNNISPRDNVIKAEKQMTQDVWRKAKRCESAHQNGLETFPIFACSVIVANMAGVPFSTINFLSTSYVISRVIYNFIYMNNESAGVAGLRTLTWSVSMGISLSLYILAARKGLSP
ncbi:17889_t:CDS:2 [Funneliformis geosporum]|uniref:388_t:CDS:1 n=1 Tax=Funneliformis geosporum TaxID=1117311 RepID=A0A9W4SRI2_9GLOM|nr:17889_t:CDS:2 [Funneliformis geosporum]CAI2176509.1 388_t:CDS:2 [Funneliformis geosporum]